MNSDVNDQSSDLRSAPPRWRAFLPAWLRGLIWVEQSTSFDAFLSYSWKSESTISPVIQSVVQTFLRPWYKPRALYIFRDLASLAASSSLQASLEQKIDQSKHLLVLASSSAATSNGMEFEAQYWFSRPREGTILIIVTEPGATMWEAVRDRQLPPTLRKNLTSAPLWVDLSAHCLKIREKPSRYAKGELTEALSQLILAFYPGKSWAELRGEERRQRRRALGLAWSAIATLALTTTLAVSQAVIATRQTAIARAQTDRANSATHRANTESWRANAASDLATTEAANAREQLNVAENRLTDLISADGRRSLLDNNYERALLFLAEAYARRPDDGAIALMAAAAIRNAPRSLRTNEADEHIDYLDFDPAGKRLLTVADGPSQVWISDAATGSRLVRLQTPPILFPPRPHYEPIGLKNDMTLMGAENGLFSQLFETVYYQRPYLSVLGARFFGHGSRVLTWGGEFSIYDAQTGRHLGDFEWPRGLAQIGGASFDPSEKMLLTYNSAGAVEVWDVQSRKLLRELEIDRAPDTDRQAYAAFDEAGRRIVVAAGDKKIRIWNTDRLDVPAAVLESDSKVVWAGFSPSDYRDDLVTVSADGPAQLWDLQDRSAKPRDLVPKGGESISRATFTKDGRIITLSGHDIVVWDEYGRPLHVLQGHTGDVADVDISADGTRLITACRTSDASARLWDLRTGTLIEAFRFSEDDTPGVVRFSPEGKRVATGSGFGRSPAKIWAVRPDILRFERAESEPHSVDIEDVNVGADIRSFTMVVNDAIETISLGNGKTIRHVKLPYSPRIASLAADGRALVMANNDDGLKAATFDAVDPSTGRILSSHAASIGGSVEALSFSPDGRLMALLVRNYSTDAHVIELWETTPWRLRYRVSPKNEPSTIARPTWSPDSAFVAIELNYDSTIVVPANGAVARQLPGQIPVFTRDGARIALSTRGLEDRRDGRFEATIHDLRSNTTPVVFRDRKQPHQDWITTLAFSPDGMQAATGSQDQTIKVWDVKTGRLLATLGETLVVGGRSRPYVTDLAYSPDGDLLASADDEGGVRLWDPQQQVLLFRMTGLYTSEAIVEKLEFTPDGGSLVLASDDWTGAFETALPERDLAFVRKAAERLVPPETRAVFSLGTGRSISGSVAVPASTAWNQSPVMRELPPDQHAVVNQLLLVLVQRLDDMSRSLDRGEIQVHTPPGADVPSSTCAEVAEAERVIRTTADIATTATRRLSQERTAWSTTFRDVLRQPALTRKAKRDLTQRATKFHELIAQPQATINQAIGLAEKFMAEPPVAANTAAMECHQQARYMYASMEGSEWHRRVGNIYQLEEILSTLRRVLDDFSSFLKEQEMAADDGMR